MKTDSKKFIEIDLLRVLAIALMMIYHLVYDLQIFYEWNMGLYGIGWSLLAKTSAGIFLFLTGMCFMISWNATPHCKKYVKRGVRILSYAAVVSIATYAFDPETYVRFGILHLIAASTFVLPFLAPLKRLSAIAGIVMIAAGLKLKQITVGTSLLLPFGIVPVGFESVDYFPLLPWMGVILIGMACGYRYETIRPNLRVRQENKHLLAMRTVSKHSLLLYMLHQPVLLILLRIVLGKGRFL